MEGGIQVLGTDVREMLKSHVAITSIVSALRELLLNSIDAGATEVQITLDLFSWGLSISDNGHGIPSHDLEHVGCLNHTSKLTKLDDLNYISTYGFRGEAIFNIQKVSKVRIISKTVESADCWARKVDGKICRLCDMDQEDNKFPFCMNNNDSGTTITVEDFFYNLPVRRKNLRKQSFLKLYDELRDTVFQVLVYYPKLNITVTVIDETNTSSIFLRSNIQGDNLKNYQKLALCFNNVFGTTVKPEEVERASATYKNYSVEGIISTRNIFSRNYQFIFINGRRYTEPSFSRPIEKMLTMSDFGGQENIGSESNLLNIKKGCAAHPVIILKTKCPKSISDSMQSPSKGVSIPSHIKILGPLIFKILDSFLHLKKFKGLSHTHTEDENILNAENLPVAVSGEINLATLRTNLVNSDFGVCSPPQGIAQPSSGKFAKKAKLAFSSTFPCDKAYMSTANRVGKTKRNLIRTAFADRPSVIPSMLLHRAPDEPFSRFNLSALQIERDHLLHSKVISQIEKKFILLRSTQLCFSKKPVLLIMDQHATDERIRLEAQLKAYLYHTIKTPGFDVINSDTTFEISNSESLLFNKYFEQFLIWGIKFHVEVSTKGNTMLHVISLPKILEQKAAGPKLFIKLALLQHAYDLENSKKTVIAFTEQIRASIIQEEHIKWWRYLNSIPTVLIDTFKSRACRSAIMFGDELTHGECVLLVKSLAKCHMPFECAHGRPSIIPLTELGNDTNADEISNGFKCKDYIL